MGDERRIRVATSDERPRSIHGDGHVHRDRQMIDVVSHAALALALGTGAARPPVALVAAPAHLALEGSARAAVRVTNSGTKAVVVDVTRAGFALSQRGRPLIVRSTSARSAAPWLTFRPGRFTLAPDASVPLLVASKLPRRAEPGDH